MKSLYFIKGAPNMPQPIMFGITPFAGLCENPEDYARMKILVGLKNDFGWKEDQIKQVLRRANIWSDFPEKGYRLVGVEFKAGDEEQRVDILYIRDDGALLPCELKIGGTSLDTHGQLIRYIADLQFQDINLNWVRNYHKKFLDTITDKATESIHGEGFEDFLTSNDIKDRLVRILPKTGIIMDEGFKLQLLKAVRYLNEYCGFSIRLIQIETFVDDNWNSDMAEYKFRIDFTDVQ